ncbi:MAG: hypothetical protein HZB38_01575 [Planctomycetes bacterium]|nr:hypothetical protein [Planctomycetota bacterium]
MIRALLLISLLLTATSCGPLGGVPIVTRLDSEEQANVDQSWANMFSPPQRLDRTLLLDTLLSGRMHERGVDELKLVSKKRVGDALVVMEVDFDRLSPDFDAFTVTYLDAPGLEMRHERYTFDEVKGRLQFLSGIDDVISSPDLSDAERERLTEERRQQIEARQKEIQAATQPAAVD